MRYKKRMRQQQYYEPGYFVALTLLFGNIEEAVQSTCRSGHVKRLCASSGSCQSQNKIYNSKTPNGTTSRWVFAVIKHYELKNLWTKWSLSLVFLHYISSEGNKGKKSRQKPRGSNWSRGHKRKQYTIGLLFMACSAWLLIQSRIICQGLVLLTVGWAIPNPK